MVAFVLFVLTTVAAFCAWVFLHGQNVTTSSWHHFVVWKEVVGLGCVGLAIVCFIVGIVALFVEGSDS